ncbi:MAG: response regulator [Candidatus Promineifilaceae bacterium]
MQILIADDEPIIRLGLKSMLEELGHSVTAVTNGREALEHHRRRSPDLAILDIQMPFTNGLQAAAAMSKQRPLPILILTAYGQDSLIEKASDLPIHGYLIKPVTPQSLSAAIAVAVKRFADAQELAEEKSALEEKLESRKIIDRAKGKLMAQGMGEEEAYQTLQKQARQTRQTIREVAESMLG